MGSLFTNVSLHRTANFQGDFILSSNILLLLPADHLRNLCTPNIRLDFENTSCGQTDDVAMGRRPLGSTSASVFLSTFEKRVKTSISHTSSSHHGCYVDDILILIDPDHLITILRDFRSKHPCFYASVEKVTNNTSRFLNSKLVRCSYGTLRRSISRKLARSVNI